MYTENTLSKKNLLSKLSVVEKLSYGSKITRFFYNPYKYVLAQLYHHFLFKLNKNYLRTSATAFYNKKLTLDLPASTDVYLTGGKTHHSELHLCHFLINFMEPAHNFIDVGAHIGYFSCLAATLAPKGQIHAFEASPSTYNLLKLNTDDMPNIRANNTAISDQQGILEFYQFPALYSEYNSSDVAQYKNEKWFENNKPELVRINCVSLDQYFAEHSISPDFIKIDVEGAEHLAIAGMKNILTKYSPVVIIEYLCEERGNANHKLAENELRKHGYTPHYITASGDLAPCNSVQEFLRQNKYDSDNIAFIKTTP